jgi:hypothetical protein
VQYFQPQGMHDGENSSTTTNGGQLVARPSSLVDYSLLPKAKEARSLTPSLAVAQIKKIIATKWTSLALAMNSSSIAALKKKHAREVCQRVSLFS